MPHYTYTDEDGNPITTYIKHQAIKCPNCSSHEIRDKGSFSKCMECGERIIDSIELDRQIG